MQLTGEYFGCAFRDMCPLALRFVYCCCCFGCCVVFCIIVLTQYHNSKKGKRDCAGESPKRLFRNSLRARAFFGFADPQCLAWHWKMRTVSYQAEMTYAYCLFSFTDICGWASGNTVGCNRASPPPPGRPFVWVCCIRCCWAVGFLWTDTHMCTPMPAV